MYSCHLFLISSASVRSILFLSFIVPIFAWNIPLVSLISLKRSLVFSFLLFSSISLHWSLRKAFLSLLAVLWNSAFGWIYFSFSPLPFACLLFSAIYKASSENHFAFLHFFFLGMVSFQILMSCPSFFNLTSGGFLVAPPLISQPLKFALWDSGIVKEVEVLPTRNRVSKKASVPRSSQSISFNNMLFNIEPFVSKNLHNCALTSNRQFLEFSERLFPNYNTQFGLNKIFHFFCRLTD